MQSAVTRRIAAGVASLGLLTAVGLSLPGLASAQALSCKGHTGKAQDTEDYENAIEYVFACTGRILGYTILADRELDAFDTEIEVNDPVGALVPSDGFACEGEIPGTGIGCYGTYGTNNVVRGTLSVAESKVCAEPRMTAKLVVVIETLDVNTGAAKKTSNGAMAGPFDLGRPRGCPKSSPVFGLFAEMEALRAQIRAARTS